MEKRRVVVEKNSKMYRVVGEGVLRREGGFEAVEGGEAREEEEEEAAEEELLLGCREEKIPGREREKRRGEEETQRGPDPDYSITGSRENSRVETHSLRDISDPTKYGRFWSEKTRKKKRKGKKKKKRISRGSKKDREKQKGFCGYRRSWIGLDPDEFSGENAL
ncbi:hypothetical protein R1flu_027725 [Riccia fluitans]|uniref:Uncharacterized protein n=1 Tax=Riccia fluitans TaxID=41844 RepID=A0ABD1XJN7_9MARC